MENTTNNNDFTTEGTNESTKKGGVFSFLNGDVTNFVTDKIDRFFNWSGLKTTFSSFNSKIADDSNPFTNKDGLGTSTGNKISEWMDKMFNKATKNKKSLSSKFKRVIASVIDWAIRIACCVLAIGFAILVIAAICKMFVAVVAWVAMIMGAFIIVKGTLFVIEKALSIFKRKPKDAAADAAPTINEAPAASVAG